MALFGAKTEDKTKEKTDSASASSNAAGAPIVLISPRISEKAGKQVGLNKYFFNVKTNANKVEIKKAVEHSYKVKVTQVNIIKMQGKNRTYGRTKGRTSGFKKAIVTLKQGDKIEGLTDVV